MAAGRHLEFWKTHRTNFYTPTLISHPRPQRSFINNNLDQVIFFRVTPIFLTFPPDYDYISAICPQRMIKEVCEATISITPFIRTGHQLVYLFIFMKKFFHSMIVGPTVCLEQMQQTGVEQAMSIQTVVDIRSLILSDVPREQQIPSKQGQCWLIKRVKVTSIH